MRGIVTLADSCPLADTKLVLFVEHDKSELGELHILLDNGMGTDHNINFTRFDLQEGISPFYGSYTANPQPTPT